MNTGLVVSAFNSTSVSLIASNKTSDILIYFYKAQQPLVGLVGQSLLIFESSRSHSDAPHLIRLRCTSN
jgi:hypothetical protein